MTGTGAGWRDVDRLGRPAASGRPTRPLPPRARRRRAIGHPSCSASQHRTRRDHPGDRVGDRVGAEHRAPLVLAPRDLPRRPRRRRRRPSRVPALRRPWPVIESQTEGPPPRDHRGRVDAELLEGPGPRCLDHHVGLREQSREPPHARRRSTGRAPPTACPRSAGRRTAVGPRRAPSGRSVDSTLTTVAPAAWPAGSRRGVRPTANPARRRPSSARVGAGRAAPNERPQHGSARRAPAGRASPKHATGSPSRRAAFDHLARPTAAHRRARSLATGPRAARRARAMPARAPRRRAARATPRSTRHAAGRRRVAPPTLVDPRRWRPAIAARSPSRARGSTSSSPPSAPAARASSVPESGQAGHEARRRTQRLTVGASGERHGTARRPCFELDASGPARVGDRSGRARCDNDRPPPGGPSPPWLRLSRLPRRPGRLRPIGRCAARGGLATGDGRRRPRHPRGRRARRCRGGGRPSSSALHRARPRWHDHATCDVVVAADGDDLAAIEATVASNPLASTSLTTLLRGAGVRAASEGLLARVRGVLLPPGRPGVRRLASGPPGQGALDGGDRVRVERDGRVLHITLTRPEVRNALDTAMRDQLVEAFELARLDDSITEVHLRGDGPSFCAGGDLDEFGARPDPATAHLVRILQSAGRSIDAVADAGHGPRPRCVPGLGRGAARVRGTRRRERRTPPSGSPRCSSGSSPAPAEP